MGWLGRKLSRSFSIDYVGPVEINHVWDVADCQAVGPDDALGSKPQVGGLGYANDQAVGLCSVNCRAVGPDVAIGSDPQADCLRCVNHRDGGLVSQWAFTLTGRVNSGMVKGVPCFRPNGPDVYLAQANGLGKGVPQRLFSAQRANRLSCPLSHGPDPFIHVPTTIDNSSFR